MTVSRKSRVADRKKTTQERKALLDDLSNRVWVSGDELLLRWKISLDDLIMYICPVGGAVYLQAYTPDAKDHVIDNVEEWTEIAEKCSPSTFKFVVNDVFEFEKEEGLVVYMQDGVPISGALANGQGDEALYGKERQELGRLREEKKKWDNAIEAAVHAALLCQGGKIKRKELWEELHRFKLPDTTLERIWKALRIKGLTKGAGAPSKTSK
jgi:hypothetical protein